MSKPTAFNSKLLDIMSVVETADSAMVIVDQVGHIVVVNKKAEKLFGYARNELLGKTIEMLMPGRLRRKHSGFRNGFFAHSAARRMGLGRIYAQRRDGSEFPAQIDLNPIQTKDGLLVLSTIAEVAEDKRNEESLRDVDRLEPHVDNRIVYLEAASRELKDFAYVLSHDLKAPLREIEHAFKWLTEDLQQHLTDEKRETINLLRGRVSRMQTLLDDLLEYSRARQEKVKAAS